MTTSTIILIAVGALVLLVAASGVALAGVALGAILTNNIRAGKPPLSFPKFSKGIRPQPPEVRTSAPVPSLSA